MKSIVLKETKRQCRCAKSTYRMSRMPKQPVSKDNFCQIKKKIWSEEIYVIAKEHAEQMALGQMPFSHEVEENLPLKLYDFTPRADSGFTKWRRTFL